MEEIKQFRNFIRKLYFCFPIFIFIFFFLIIITLISVISSVTQIVSFSGKSSINITYQNDVFKKIPDNVLKYKDKILEYMKKYEISEGYLPYILAQATQESYGKSIDLFQASESKYNGKIGMIKTVDESIDQAMKRWNEIIKQIEEKNLKFSVELILQTYNFGSGYLDFVKEQGGEYTEENAKAFSEYMIKKLGSEWTKFNGSKYGDINYIKNIFRYIDFEFMQVETIPEEYTEEFNNNINLSSGDETTLKNFISDFNTPDKRSLEGGIPGVENYSYKYYGRQCVSWCYNRWFEVHGWNTGKMADGGRWNEAVYGKNLIVLQSATEKEKVKPGCTISFSGGNWGQYGHIAFIEKILTNGTLIISEQNYDNKGSFRQRFSYKKEWSLNTNYFV